MKKTSEEIESSNQTLVDHLSELRSRLTKVLFIVFIGMILCYNYSEQIFLIIREPIRPYLPGGGLVFTAPMDKFVAHLKLSFAGGVVLTCPVWLYQVWKFIAPGLYSKEKKYALGFIFSGSILFLFGVCFAYFVVFPMAFDYLMKFGGDLDKPMITIDHYLGFFITTTLMFGVAFELPLIIVMMGMLGVVSQKFLREKRRLAVVVLAVLSAILTPPDILSMTFMLVPMYFLYEISVVLVGFFEKKRLEASQV